jgi:hypothetical protein
VGIKRYTALVSGDNRAVLPLLERIGARVLSADASSGTVEYEIRLPAAGLGNTLRAALRAAASGHMTLPRRVGEALTSLLDHPSDAG